MPPWWPLLELPSWCPSFEASQCNSFQDRAPVDFIYGCPIFEWVAETWQHDRVPGEYPQQWLLGDMPYTGKHSTELKRLRLTYGRKAFGLHKDQTDCGHDYPVSTDKVLQLFSHPKTKQVKNSFIRHLHNRCIKILYLIQTNTITCIQ